LLIAITDLFVTSPWEQNEMSVSVLFLFIQGVTEKSAFILTGKTSITIFLIFFFRKQILTGFKN
jgi:hypothetical protein